MTPSELVRDLERLGVHLWEEAGQLHFRAPKGALTDEKRKLMREHKLAILELVRLADQPVVIVDPHAREEPFPLTDVQSAYLLGRNVAFAYGGVGCHGYAELDFEALDVDRLERAWQSLVARHDMLRATIDPRGFQRVQADVPRYRIATSDCRRDHAAAEAAIVATREALSHRVYQPDRWPLFALHVTLGPHHARLHVSIDFLIADYVSIFIILDELREAYDGTAPARPPLAIGFRDYLLAAQRRRTDHQHARARAYWHARIDELPPAPEIPTAPTEAQGGSPRFRRFETTLSRGAWTALRDHATRTNITPSTAVLAVFADTIATWSRSPQFTLNVTLLQRPALHPDVPHIIGDFTSVNLLAVDHDPDRTFAERAGALQTQLWSDLDHTAYSGVEVLRELVRRRGRATALMPIVFTSAIGLSDETREGAGLLGLGTLVWGISQTPQVWIDCQVMERRGELALNWDVRERIFPDGMIEDMFAAFVAHLAELSTDVERWQHQTPVALPSVQLARRALINATAVSEPEHALHELVWNQCLRRASAPAVISGTRTLTYGELAARAAAVAGVLHELGCHPRDLVGVVTDRGWEQPVALLAVLVAGGGYVPVDPEQPTERRRLLLAGAGIRFVLCQSWLVETVPAGCIAIAIDEIDPAPAFRAVTPYRPARDDVAYVIHTSGSTGTPKGVMISHAAAVNTIADINARFEVGATDSVLGLSNLGFDLSVYDVFGTLSAGGRLVMPRPGRGRDPSHWAQLIIEHGVTIWNSVPAQMQMLRDYLVASPPGASSLRLALLSGDWIPVRLPDDIRALFPGLEVVSLGGATEAAIWSIIHRIGYVPREWTSIPYGTPLANQRFEILDAGFARRPDHVPGELFIAGSGLALGYLGDPARTAERFIINPHTGERQYRTGDHGRYLPNGEIEFLGRRDQQVKVRGHRIELGEVAAALERCTGIGRAAVIADGTGLERRLVAYVEPAHGATATYDDAVVCEAMLAESARIAGSIDRERYRRYLHELERLGLMAMVATLRELGALAAHDATRIAPRHHRLVQRWFGALTSAPSDVLSADRSMLAEAWRSFEDAALVPEPERGLVGYFRACANHLPEIVAGERDALPLLFPDGKLEVADELYRNGLFHRWANASIAAAVRTLARIGEPTLRVLEVGAGTGATTAAALEALTGSIYEYTFTDVSAFYLGEARRQFVAYPELRYGLFDLMIDLRAQGWQPNSFDLVIAGDVLHATPDIDRALAQITEVLAPGGVLLLAEMTRDHAQIMTSLETVIGGRELVDERGACDQTFLARARWHDGLRRAGGDIVAEVPAGDELLEAIGMRVFAARVKRTRASITVRGLGAELATILPPAMIPSTIEIIDGLPRTANDKLDARTLELWAANTAGQRTVAAAPPATELEQRIAATWSVILGLAEIGRDQDFFSVGGDSLLAARLAGELRQRVPEAAAMFFDELLQRLLEGATVASLAVAFAATPQGAQAADNTPPPGVAIDGTGEELYVLAPTGLEQLAVELASRSCVASFSAGAIAVPIDRRIDELVTAAREHRNPVRAVVGWNRGGVVALQIARRLAEAGQRVDSVVFVGALPLPIAIEDPLIAEAMFAREAGLDPSALGYPSDRALGALLRLGTGGRIAEGAWRALDDQEVSSAMCALGERSSAQRLRGLAAALALDELECAAGIAQMAVLADTPPYSGDVVYLRPRVPTSLWPNLAEETERSLRERCLGDLRVVTIDGDPFSCVREVGAALGGLA